MPPIAEVFCKNGLNHKDGKRRFGKFPESLCPECLAKREEPNRVSPREVPFSPTKADFELSDRIQSLAAKINADFDSTIDNCWKRNRQYLLQLRHELEVAYENNQSLQEQLAQKEREIQELRCQKTLVAC